jgi:hypothetical protein
MECVEGKESPNFQHSSLYVIYVPYLVKGDIDQKRLAMTADGSFFSIFSNVNILCAPFYATILMK